MTDRARETGGVGVLTPLVVLVLVMSLLGAPLGLLVDPWGIWELFVPPDLRADTIWQAYWWTVYGCAMLYAAVLLFGIPGRLREYQRRPSDLRSPGGLRSAWWVTGGLALAAVVIMFAQAGFRVPLLQAVGAEYLEYAALRMTVRQAVNQNLFNVALYLLAAPNLAIAWFEMPRSAWGYRLGSLALVVAVGSFTLARSPVGVVGLLLAFYLLLTRPIRWRVFVAAAAALLAIITLNHMIAEQPTGYASVGGYLFARLVYGEWLALPKFFQLFDHHHVPLASILPPVLQAILGSAPDSPARIVITDLVPEAVDEGRAGAANAFFIGDAYAVAGNVGALLAPLIVAIELWLIVLAFRHLPKTPLTSLLFSWFLFRFSLGIVGGFSVFVLSAFVVLLALVVGAMLARAAVRKRLRAALA